EPLAALAGTVTTIVTVTVAPAAIVPRLPLITLPLCISGAALLAVADTKVTPAGSVSRNCTFWASDGPELRTATVYVRLVPAITGSGVSFLVTTMSAAALTAVVSVSLLLAALGSVVAVLLTVAVLLIVEPSATLAPTRTTS